MILHVVNIEIIANAKISVYCSNNMQLLLIVNTAYENVKKIDVAIISINALVTFIPMSVVPEKSAGLKFTCEQLLN